MWPIKFKEDSKDCRRNRRIEKYFYRGSPFEDSMDSPEQFVDVASCGKKRTEQPTVQADTGERRYSELENSVNSERSLERYKIPILQSTSTRSQAGKRHGR